MKIKVFSTETCPYCTMAKDFLKEKGVAYEDVNVAEDEAARNEMIEKSKQMGVPVILVTKNDDSEEILVGFDKDRLNVLINEKDSEPTSKPEDKETA